MPQSPQNNSGKLQEKLIEIHQREQELRTQNLAAKLDLPYLNLTTFPIQSDALALIDEKTSRQGKIVVIKKEVQNLKIALVEPKNPTAQKTIDDFNKKGFKLSLFIISEHGLAKAFKAYKNIVLKEKEIEGEVKINKPSLQAFQKEIKNIGDVKAKIASLKQGGASAILEIILAGALQNEASDIHWESQEGGSLLRFRIDGLLQEITFLPSKIANLVLSRLKLISGVALNIKDKPQDGRFTIEVNALDFEVRASFIPSPNGENVVLRLLNPKTINLTLKDLGLRQDSYEILKKEIKRPNGLIITTGPTGSGKTTTLYAFLKETADPKIKIITLEDPIEYHLKGITQTQVEAERGYTFVQGLRAVLRQDPDVIMVGEIRDQETAEIAIQAALTGHLVFSTLHTNDAAGAIPRFLDLDTNPKSLASALTVTMAQRLVRRLCVKCKKDYQPSREEKEKIKKTLANLPSNVKIPKIGENFKLFKPTGCPQCNKTGFKGRVGVYEIISSDPDLEKFISQTPGHAEILEFLQKKGFVSMLQDGILKALEGITSIEELESVVGER